MKTFVEPDSKQLEQCIFPQMFIRYRLYFRGEGGLGNFQKKNPAQQKLTKYREREPQGASTIIILFFFTFKKKTSTSYCPPKKICAQPKCEKKMSCPRKFPTLTSPLEENKGIRVWRLMM